MRINTNISALNSQRILGQTNAAASKQIGRLSSGFRINSAKDDAAGLAIANKLRSATRAMGQAARNTEQANSMLQIADGASQTVTSILDRMKELGAQAASDNVGTERGKLADEFNALKNEIGRILESTTYQGTKVLTELGTSLGTTLGGAAAVGTNGLVAATATRDDVVAQAYTITVAENADPTLATITLAGADGSSETLQLDKTGAQTLEFKGLGISLEMDSQFDTSSATGLDTGTVTVAATSTAKTVLVGASGDYDGTAVSGGFGGDTLKLDIGSMQAAYDAIENSVLTDLGTSQSALAAIDTALGHANTFVGKLGAVQSRLDYAKTNLESIMQNTSAAESTIRDADMAQEMTELSRVQILQQAGTAMLAQANQAPQGVLQLLR